MTPRASGRSFVSLENLSFLGIQEKSRIDELFTEQVVKSDHGIRTAVEKDGGEGGVKVVKGCRHGFRTSRLEHHPLASSPADQRETGIVSNLDIHGIRNQTKETKSQRFDIDAWPKREKNENRGR